MIKRAVLLIHEFDCRLGSEPLMDDKDDWPHVTPEHSGNWFHSTTLDRIMNEGVILFCDTPFNEHGGHFHFSAMPVAKIRNSKFWHCKDEREDFLLND